MVFVNLQGMFIFAFHCVRNPQVRSSWISAVRSILITTSSYMSPSQTPNTLSKGTTKTTGSKATDHTSTGNVKENIDMATTDSQTTKPEAAFQENNQEFHDI